MKSSTAADDVEQLHVAGRVVGLRLPDGRFEEVGRRVMVARALDANAVAIAARSVGMALFAARDAASAHGPSANFITPEQIIPRQNRRPIWC